MIISFSLWLSAHKNVKSYGFLWENLKSVVRVRTYMTFKIVNPLVAQFNDVVFPLATKDISVAKLYGAILTF